MRRMSRTGASQQQSAGRGPHSKSWRAGTNKGRQVLSYDQSNGGSPVDTNTLLLIVLIVLLVGGGGFYGRGRWW
jgi:hypothetical protein